MCLACKRSCAVILYYLAFKNSIHAHSNRRLMFELEAHLSLYIVFINSPALKICVCKTVHSSSRPMTSLTFTVSFTFHLMLEFVQEANNMANTKEKTSMCLLNELARFNKLQPKYELVSEKGPPHEKIFSVCLTLGTQKYDSSGASIKKAQHGAAASALEKCGLPHPVPRVSAQCFCDDSKCHH